jgi:HD-GYP domain-containing protein (c-di-GMP phosphodiesterase class II)
VIVERIDVTIPVGSGSVTTSIGAPIAFAAGLHFGIGAGALVVLIGHVVDSTLARRDPIKSLTNISTHVLATCAGAATFILLGDREISVLASPSNIGAGIMAALLFFLVNSWSFAFIVGPVLGLSPAAFWRANIKLAGLDVAALPTLGGLVTVLADENGLALMLFLIPLLLPQVAYRALTQAQRNVREAIETLSDVIERREPDTANHSIRVSQLVRRILKEMPEVPHELTETIVAAARVHDLGKVAVRDTTLLKSGPLTMEERLEMDQHAPVGAQIVGRIAAYQATTAIIRHHHERWDGTGYPDRLAHEMIPLGSRIIAVADTYDAMTSDRTYRKGLSHDRAMQEIIRGSGSQFDPAIVIAFERVMQDRGALNQLTSPIVQSVQP